MHIIPLTPFPRPYPCAVDSTSQKGWSLHSAIYPTIRRGMPKDTIRNQSIFDFGEEANKEIHKEAHLKETGSDD